MLKFEFISKCDFGYLWFNELEFKGTFIIHENEFTCEFLFQELKRVNQNFVNGRNAKVK